MKKFLLSLVGFLCSLVTIQAEVVTFSATGRPATWDDMVARKADGTVIASGADVAKGTQVTFNGTTGVGYHIDWYVNGEKNAATGGMLTLSIDADTQVEAKYVEHYKFIFAGTPFVKYADEKGIIVLTQNYYQHSFQVDAGAFAYTLDSWKGSNGKVYLPDNILTDTIVTRDTLTADVTLTPHYLRNESDLGDGTATAVWRFAYPDSLAPLFRNFGGAGAVCSYVMPTLIENAYVDLNMSCDATNGKIDNEHRVGMGSTFVGKGTRFTIPARYGTVFKLVAEQEFSATTIAGRRDYVKGMEAAGHTATLYYYDSTKDSIDIVIGEDLALVSISASYPGGDNILSWTPNYKTAESELGTFSKTGEAGCLLFNLSDIINNGGLVVTPSALDSLSSQIEMPVQKDANKFISVSFEIAEGFSFLPKAAYVPIKMEGAGTTGKVELVLVDEQGHQLDTLFTNVKSDSLMLDTLKNRAKSQEEYFYGKVTLMIYVYGAAANYRFGFPISVEGEICETVTPGEGNTYATYVTKSAIDFDGLFGVYAYEVVSVDERRKVIKKNPIEECPMGDAILIQTDVPGAIYNIPLTRRDDRYDPESNILHVSDGTVVGDRTRYIFSQEYGIYAFKVSTFGETIPEGEVYLEYDSFTDPLAYYLDSSIPTDIDVVDDATDIASKMKETRCVLRNGRIYIVKPDGTVYTMTGVRVQ